MKKIITIRNNFQLIRQILVMIVLTTVCNSHLVGKSLTIKKISAPMSISSAVWDTIAWINVDIPNGKTIGFSGKFKMCYDNNNIYVLVSVNDATPYKTGYASWASDCVELFFAMDTSNSMIYRYGDWQLRKQAALGRFEGGVDGSGGYEYGNTWSIDELLNDDEFVVNQIDGNNSYLVAPY